MKAERTINIPLQLLDFSSQISERSRVLTGILKSGAGREMDQGLHTMKPRKTQKMIAKD